MPTQEAVLDLASVDVSEEAWDQIVADLAREDPDVLGAMRNVALASYCYCCAYPWCC